jgi:hypothetical protein
MSISHLFRVAIGIVLSGAIGWISLAIFNMIKIMQGLEAFEAAPDREFDRLPMAMEQAIANISGGSAVFLAAGIAGVLLSEIFKTRSLLFYASATGALTAVFAAALWQQSHFGGTAQAAASLAMAGFVAGTVYWIVAVPSSRPKT